MEVPRLSPSDSLEAIWEVAGCGGREGENDHAKKDGHARPEGFFEARGNFGIALEADYQPHAHHHPERDNQRHRQGHDLERPSTRPEEGTGEGGKRKRDNFGVLGQTEEV